MDRPLVLFAPVLALAVFTQIGLPNLETKGFSHEHSVGQVCQNLGLMPYVTHSDSL